MADKQPQSVDSVETSNMEFPKPVEAVGKVGPPKAGVEASVKEINAELQEREDEERYDSCKDDMSTDSQIQENRRDMCAETDADSENVGKQPTTDHDVRDGLHSHSQQRIRFAVL